MAKIFAQSPLSCVLRIIAIVVASSHPNAASAQTPSPLQEWQYSAGIDLIKLFAPVVPDWRVDIGVAADYRPLYEGAETYRVLGGPVIDVRYKDLAFFSVGEGIGVNVLRGANYRAGIAIGYDLGRRDEQDLAHLRGLGDVGRAPSVKAFGDYVISKQLPLVLRLDARKIIGGARGWVVDVDAFLPLPGSSERFVVFAGPSVKFADRQHLQTLFGVSYDQSNNSGYPEYSTHGGLNSAGFGLSATWVLSNKWLLNIDAAANRLFGSPTHSPIVQANTQSVGNFSIIYRW